MNDFNQLRYTMKITDLIKDDKKTNNKQLSHLYQSELFDFFEEIPKNQYQYNNELSLFCLITSSNVKSLTLESFEDLFKYVNVFFFNKIKEKLQSNEKNSKTTKIKLNDLDETPSKSWKLKVEDYVTEVELLLRKILKSNVDDERNFKVTMILSNDFSNLLENKSNNEFHCFAKFDNLLKKYNIQCINHDFLNKSNEFIIRVPIGISEVKMEKINSNLKKNIILLFITKKQDDFRFKIDNTIQLSPYKEILKNDEGTLIEISFNKEIANLSNAKIFAIKS